VPATWPGGACTASRPDHRTPRLHAGGTPESRPAYIASLRWSGAVERRTRPDGVYEWYATGDGPLEVEAMLTR
jgi:hypothetical protein